MKEIVNIIMIIIFYGLGSVFFIAMIINQKKLNQLNRKYWEEQILEMQKKRIKEYSKRKKESEEK